jgi:anti-sigma factor RsiW
VASDLNFAADEIVCNQLVELVTDYLEGALPSRTLSQVEEHLVMCERCVTYVEQMQATVDALGGLKDKASHEPSDSLLAALRANMAAEP